MSERPRSRVKLICSYGGRFQPLPGGRRLFYLGGESKLIIVDRSIRLFTLLARLSFLFGTRHDVLLKYRLAGEDPTALQDIIDEDDFERMMIGHDHIQRRSAYAHICLFLFPVGCCPSKKTTGTTQAELPPLIDLSDPAPDARPTVANGFPERIQRQIEELQAGMQQRTQKERSPQVICVACMVARPDGASLLLLMPPTAVIEGPYLVVCCLERTEQGGNAGDYPALAYSNAGRVIEVPDGLRLWLFFPGMYLRSSIRENPTVQEKREPGRPLLPQTPLDYS